MAIEVVEVLVPGIQGPKGDPGPAGSGSGDVNTVGAPVVAGRLVRYNGTSGDAIEDAGVSVSDLQPVDSDLTAIAALSTTAFGRSLLTAADAAALRTTAGLVIGTNVQAFDSDLAAIAGLSTQAFGRSLLEQASAQAALETLGAWRMLASSAVASSHTGSTTETTLATIQVPANALGPNGILRIHVVWNFEGANGNRTPRVKFGGTTFFNPTMASSRFGQRLVLDIFNRNNAGAQVGFPIIATSVYGESTSDANNPFTAAIDTTQNQNIELTGQLVNGADTISVEAYMIEILKKA